MLSAGVEAAAEMRLGVHWSAAEGWQRVQEMDYNTSYCNCHCHCH